MSLVKNFDTQIQPTMRKILKQEGEKEFVVFLDEAHNMLGHVELPLSLTGIQEKAEEHKAKYLLLLYLMAEDHRILREERAKLAQTLKENLPDYPILDLIVCTPKQTNSFSQVIYF